MKTSACLSLSLLFLTGCAAPPPTPQELAAADYGAYPGQYREVVTAYMQTVLKDPASAMYSVPIAPVKNRYQGVYGWATCMGVNSKNSFGGYTGVQPHYFLIRNGEVIKVEHGGARASFETDWVMKLCRALV